MRNIDFPMLLLAILVIAMFSGIGVAIGLGSIWLILLFLILGFGLMGYGLSLKQKRK